MSFEESWQKALKNTEIIRSRIQALQTNWETKVPYIFLSESSINQGDTVVRKGEIVVERPGIILPPNNPQFKGFQFEEGKIGENDITNFFIVRGVRLPSLHYDNRTNSLDVVETNLAETIKYFEDILQKEENVHSGLITGPEDCWRFSLIIFICSQILRNTDADIKKFLNDFRKFT